MKALSCIVPSLCTVALASTRKILDIPPPHFSRWRHNPVFLKASSKDTKVIGHHSKDEGLPLGVPFEFETPLFKGQMLVRLRNAKSDSPDQHNAYFAGNSKRLMQTVVQGKFKRPVSMSDVFVGSLFRKPLKKVPPRCFVRVMNTIVSRVSPGVVLDLASQKPKILSLYAGSAQTFSVDLPGDEPDISGRDIPENVSRAFGHKFKSISSRRKKMSSPKSAKKYWFDTKHVYTFHMHDDAMDYANYSMHLPMYGDYDLSQALGPQPMTLTAVTSKGDYLFSFDVWHEKVYPREEL